MLLPRAQLPFSVVVAPFGAQPFRQLTVGFGFETHIHVPRLTLPRVVFAELQPIPFRLDTLAVILDWMHALRVDRTVGIQ